ncbi:uncharacterized protein LOC142542899 [Primulina tabacum]|uniref:uncharacterized protein LOC142542899 n=1 Tax=Primulina tabacum TaxID=48773 RepID=UPI003F5960E3
MPRNHDAFSIFQGTNIPILLYHNTQIHMSDAYFVNPSTMAASMRFSNAVTMQSIQFNVKPEVKHSFHSVFLNRPCGFQEPDIGMLLQPIHLKKSIKSKSLQLFAIPSSNSNIKISADSPANTIMQFYSAINEKKLKKLDKLMAEDCFFEDFSFSKPFHGKKEVLHFFEQIISCMGQNMQFNIDHICEGNDFTAAVSWHLDWNNIQVPLTRGCSYYSLSADGDKQVITKVRVFIEPPIKLGGVALTMFKIVTSLFDAFPAATEWFLKRSHIIFQVLLKTHSIIIQPIISPFQEWYIKLVQFAACILSFILKIIYYLSKNLKL